MPHCSAGRRLPLDTKAGVEGGGRSCLFPRRGSSAAGIEVTGSFRLSPSQADSGLYLGSFFPLFCLVVCSASVLLLSPGVQRESSPDGRSARAGRLVMLSGGREGLFELGSQLQRQGESQAALHCFLSCLLGLTHVNSFSSLPHCLHQIAELFIEDKNYVKALQFIQAEKMFYEVALIELAAVQGSSAGPLEPNLSPSLEWDSPAELSEQASQAQDYERLAQLCLMSKRPHLALEYSGKATKIRQKAFGNNHPITTKSLKLLASVYAEIGKTEYSDSLGQCMSALSKTLAPTDALGEALNGAPHTHRRSEVHHHHRKEPRLPQEAPKQKIASCKFPTSILKKSGWSSVDKDPAPRRRSERRVHFREPEITVHAYDAPPGRPHLALFSSLFLLLSVLGVVLYCGDRRRPLRVCEELEAALAVYFLQMKQVVWGCWVWLTMQ